MKPKHSSKRQPELFWPRVVVRKWFNFTAKDSDYSADSDDDDTDYLDADSDTEEIGQSRFRVNKEEEAQVDPKDAFPRIRRRKSETFRAQYINTKELRIRVGTWNVGGKIPPDDLDIDDWIGINDPADIFVLGLQEIVPLNAGNIFGAEDSRPVTKWENIIRDTLSRIRPASGKIKCFSDPPSPSKFKPADDIPDIEEEIVLESDSDVGEEVYPLDEETNSFDEVKEEPIMTYGTSYSTLGAKLDMPVGQDVQRQFSSIKKFDRLNCLRTEYSEGDVEAPSVQNNRRLTKMLSGSEKIGLCWPEPPLNLLTQNVLERPNSFKSIKSFKTAKSFKTYGSFNSVVNDMSSAIALLSEIDLENLMKRKRRSSYVRIVSKQMVGIFLTIWVRRSLRRHIQNVRVSTVGVGVMGYIGNKGSISVSMSIHQTLFCFICTHLTSGEKEGDEQKRNADVYEIHRRTRFYSQSEIGFPKSIFDHEKMIWLGDLNYRINLPYEKTRELISKKDWSKLMEKDQLIRELRRGRPFDGWSEGTLNFPPTYKYDVNSGKYCGEDPKAGRRTPAWCDRILSYGKGMRLLKYRRAELKMSDHRPVTATYVAEVEEFSHKKLQRALTFTDAEIENEEVVADLGVVDVGLSNLRVDLTWRATAFGVYGYLNFTRNGFLEHAKNFKEEDMQKRIEGKNCIVTGANSGIGYATAEGLASRGATVYMVCRSKERGEAALSSIQSKTGNPNIHLEVCDLSSVNDIKSFTSRFSAKDMPVHVLVNNAGLLEKNRVVTPEGFETNFAVNVLGTYTMTELMLPLLEKAAPDARVITVSSGGMYSVPLTTDLQFSSGKFAGVEQYARNKRVQVALTEEWSEMYKEKAIGFYSMHPGWAETPGVTKSLPSFSERFAGKLRTSEEGADTVVWLALQPKEKLVPGAFYFDRAEAPKHLKFAATGGSRTAIDSIVANLRSMANLPPLN
ncbi:hypothetical protein Pint_07868 [Pistacia integerrima]|uniref:Uncharacterized protein n=1 Tax=Pistacia integerrima TaxID=434235 RepID=A0ACC0XWU5_9ROSI|nr:hypothetical protein Pint_07868 [Pistacia integerrima]